MMRFTRSLITLGVLIGSLSHAVVAEPVKTQIQWVKPENFKDISAGHSESQKNFQKRLFAAIEKHIQNIANEMLPEQFTLAVAIYDMDLSGEIKFDQSYSGMKKLRVVGTDTPPVINLGYLIVDKHNNDVKSGAEVLYESNFRYKKVQSNEFAFEKRLLTRWLKEEFEDLSYEGNAFIQNQ